MLGKAFNLLLNYQSIKDISNTVENKKRPAGFIRQVAFLFTFDVAMLVGAFLSNLPELHSVLFGYRFIVEPHLYKCYRIKNTGKKHYAYTDKNE